MEFDGEKGTVRLLPDGRLARFILREVKQGSPFSSIRKFFLEMICMPFVHW